MRNLINTIIQRALLRMNPTTAGVLKQFDKTVAQLDEVAQFQKQKAKSHTDKAAKLQAVVANQVSLHNKAMREAEAASEAAARISKLIRG